MNLNRKESQWLLAFFFSDIAFAINRETKKKKLINNIKRFCPVCWTPQWGRSSLFFLQFNAFMKRPITTKDKVIITIVLICSMIFAF